MVTDEIIARLRWHAGLEGVDSNAPSISECTYRGGSRERLWEAVADFVVAVQRLNIELNGDPPSAVGGHVDEVPRDAVYAVCEVSRMLREDAEHVSGEQCDAALRAARLVDAAWNAVLAGDIDDIAAELAHAGLASPPH